MTSRFYIESLYGYPIEDEDAGISVKASNGEELVRFSGEEARELFSILTGNQGLFEKGDRKMATKRKTSGEEETVVLDLDDGAKFKTKKNFNSITGPAHYISGRKYEPRKVIMDWDLDFYLGNVVKYISRAGRKGDVLEDLRKARQYLDWEIELLEEALN